MIELSATPPKSKWKSIVQLVFCILALLGFSLLTAFLFYDGILTHTTQGNTSGDVTTMLSLAWGFLLMTVLLFVLMILTIFNLKNKPQPNWDSPFWTFFKNLLPFIIILWPVVLLLGSLVVNDQQKRWLLLPPLHILAISIPIIWLIYLAKHGLQTSNPHRSLSIFCVGMVGSSMLALIVEGLLLVGVVIVFIVILSTKSSASTTFQLELLAQRLSQTQNDPNGIYEIFRPYLMKPLVLMGLLAILSGFIPMIEEFLKPLAVWILGGELKSPTEGFTTGILAGAGFTLIESLERVGATSSSEWLTLEIGRAGTDLLHIFTAGLMGWALVHAWHYRRYWLPMVTFLVAVFFHGVWNGLILCLGFIPFFNFSPTDLSISHSLTLGASIGLGILIVIMVAVLFSFNRLLKVRYLERTPYANHPLSD